MSNYRYLNFFHFSMALLLLESFYAFFLPKRSHHLIRFCGSLALYFLLGLIWCPLVRIMPNAYAASLGIHVILFVCTLGVLAFCLDVNWNTIFNVGTAGFATQHIVYSSVSLFRWVTGLTTVPLWVSEIFYGILPYVAGGLIVYHFFISPNRLGSQLKKKDPRLIAVSFAVLTCCLLLSVYIQNISMPRGQRIAYNAYDIIACSLALAVQFGISRQIKLEENTQLLEQMLHTEKQQHEQMRDTIDMINMKCHDLKYQIASLRQIPDDKDRNEYLSEVEHSVMIYDSHVNSGNDAVDLILTEKMLVCQKYQIVFSYMIEGEKLGFMSTSDTYALFGNAIDNAIESLQKAPVEKRTMMLRVEAHGEILHFHLDNYCENLPEFVDGLPQTTKTDHNYHGFGTRSISYIAEKYGAHLTMCTSDQHFILDILFNMANYK